MTRQAPQGGWNVKGGSRPLGLRSPAGCQEAFPTELRARGLVSAQAAGGTCSFLLRSAPPANVVNTAAVV